MGELYCLTDEELNAWRNLVKDQLTAYKTTKTLDHLKLFFIWLYEFAEAFAVNNKNEQAKLGRAKDKYTDSGFIRRLFAFRGGLVHRPYSVNEYDVIEFYNDRKMELEQLMKECGFPMVTELHSF